MNHKNTIKCTNTIEKRNYCVTMTFCDIRKSENQKMSAD